MELQSGQRYWLDGMKDVSGIYVKSNRNSYLFKDIVGENPYLPLEDGLYPLNKTYEFERWLDTGIYPFRLIAVEMQRSADKYGYTDEHITKTKEDYRNGELAEAAAAYCMSGVDSNEGKDIGTVLFPWSLEYFKPSPEDRIKELVKAASMIVREINRLTNI